MKKMILSIAAAHLLLSSCATMNKQQKGTAVGAVGGAAAGAAVSKGSIWGILAGAAIGGLAGNLIGKKMDQQAAELKQAIPSAEIERVGEGINVTFDSGLMFSLNSHTISDTYKSDLASAADVFSRHPETHLVLEGHTDDTGSDEYNMTLSKQRANAVKDFLVSRNISPDRIDVKWYGEAQPKYPNDSELNRQKNRRVELAVIANDQMKQKAKDGQLEQ